uniref:Uncharacterized protein n=1 Tax=Plectus sambesii TaxID=2011161 RepID=A0A914V3N0_9BILA
MTSSRLYSDSQRNRYNTRQPVIGDSIGTRDNSYNKSFLEWWRICRSIEKNPAYIKAADVQQRKKRVDLTTSSFGIFAITASTSRRQKVETDDSRCDTRKLILTEEKVKCRDLCLQCFPRSMAHCEVNYHPSFTRSLVGRSCSCTYGTYYDAVFRDGAAYSIL